MLLEFSEEFLRMTPRLRARPRLYELLNAVPVLPKLHQPLQELVVFLIGPLALVVFPFGGHQSVSIIGWAFKGIAYRLQGIKGWQEGKLRLVYADG